jgi:DNA repair exonuclease SbcCD ATPase subunit
MGKQHQILKQPIEEQANAFVVESETVISKFRNLVQHVRNELIDMDIKWTKSSDLEKYLKELDGIYESRINMWKAILKRQREHKRMNGESKGDKEKELKALVKDYEAKMNDLKAEVKDLKQSVSLYQRYEKRFKELFVENEELTNTITRLNGVIAKSKLR